MRPNPSKTLKILFDIKQDVIDCDLRHAEEGIGSIANEISSILALPLTERTPETEARLAHLWMVRAYEFCHRDIVVPELKASYAAFGAEDIVQDAETVAWDKDTCAELSSRMDLIRRREGLTDDEFWAIGEGPQDYRKLDNELGRVLESVWDTVFVFVLRRYHMDEYADLFERDRREFEIQREIGSRFAWPKTEDMEKEMDDHFRSEHGADALQRVQSRVKELRELIGERND